MESAGADRDAVSSNGFAPARPLRSRSKVLPEHARGHNRALVLQTLYHLGAMSRADLSRQTGLTRVTISDLVSEFIADGIVVEQGIREKVGPGKPAILVDLDRAGHQIIGLDLSEPDYFRGALLSLDGDVLVRRETGRPAQPDGQASYDAIVELIRLLRAESTVSILGVGVGTPGIVRPDGFVISAPNLGWTNFPLEARLCADLDCAVAVSNDANTAVLAEYTFGDAASDVMLVKIGVGVGAGVITGGHLLLGSRFAAGEIGHVKVGTDVAPRCVCGRDGCLEAWVSVPGLVSAIAAQPDQEHTILSDAGSRLGIAIAPVLSTLDVAEIVLSGPAELLGDTLIDAVIETLRSRVIEGVFDDVSVRLSAQEDIVLRGAAVNVLASELGVS